jgi:hypothetical protein
MNSAETRSLIMFVAIVIFTWFTIDDAIRAIHGGRKK